MRRFVIAGLCVLPLLALSVLGGFQVWDATHHDEPDLFAAIASAPIPGLPVASDEALSMAPNGLPALGTSAVQNVCADGSGSLQLLSTWASSKDVPAEAQQFGMTYSNGVWLAVDSVTGYDETVQSSVQKTGDLPPLDVAMPDEAPGDLEVGKVRGHVAWEKGLSDDFSCSTTQYRDVDASQGAASEEEGASPAPQPVVSPTLDSKYGVIFAPTATSSIRWAEKGYVILLVGPYPLPVLESIAEGIQWER